MIKATLIQRKPDAWGDGAYGASRGTRTHRGIDYSAYPGTVINSHVIGVVTKLGYPYSDDLHYRYVEITSADQCKHRFFYVSPGVKVGDTIVEGQPIGIVQDISSRYRDEAKPPMTNHAHYEIKRDGEYINPEDYDGFL